jgi:prepilin-type N-terminal cleavage/methylation domain-containing protein
MRKGVSIVEVLVAVVVLAVTASAVFPVMWWLINKSGGLRYEAEASTVLQQGMEAAYNVVIADWDAVQASLTYYPSRVLEGGGQRWVLVEGEDEVAARFTRGIAVEAVCRNASTGQVMECAAGGLLDLNSKMLTGTVTWQEKGVTRSVSAKLMVVNM